MSDIKATSPHVAWHISSYSANGGGQCVEAGRMLDGSGQVAVRDSQRRDQGHLAFTHREWAAFLQATQHGQL
ncbi:DUF397 domain-containing protein [Spiractinospora alimapuensis]|uniref:DUF397 domain-containing protein n=1 Tax=Spiractinospora alimapuensis TaxID=2820884 RepID=UPI001F422A59|nr:DUF397 domain-containing protein [Spiractinospora alimapuensis]QVQ52004.1 DUF397 domain-containing protein [Spiractinospora alimapuensis]